MRFEPRPFFVYWDLLRIFPTWRTWWGRVKCCFRRRHRWVETREGFTCECDLHIQTFFADDWHAEIVENAYGHTKIRFWKAR